MSEERDAMARMELITELSRMDDAQTVTALLKMLSAEKEPRVREQAVAIVGFMASTAKQMKQRLRGDGENYPRADAPRETADAGRDVEHPGRRAAHGSPPSGEQRGAKLNVRRQRMQF